MITIFLSHLTDTESSALDSRFQPLIRAPFPRGFSWHWLGRYCLAMPHSITLRKSARNNKINRQPGGVLSQVRYTIDWQYFPDLRSISSEIHQHFATDRCKGYRGRVWDSRTLDLPASKCGISRQFLSAYYMEICLCPIESNSTRGSLPGTIF